MTASVLVLNQDNKVQISDGFIATVTEWVDYKDSAKFETSKPDAETEYEFIGWYEGTLTGELDEVFGLDSAKLVDKGNPFVYNVEENKALTAIYKSGKYLVSARVQGRGQIIMDNQVVANSEDGSYLSEEFYFGNDKFLTAQAEDGYVFAGWYDSNGKLGNDVTYRVHVSGNTEIFARFVAKSLEFDVDPAVSINGILYQGELISEFNYGLVEWGTYANDTFEKDANGSNKTVKSYTDASVYVRIEAFDGYTFDAFYAADDKASGTATLVFASEDDKVRIYEISGLNADETNGYGFIARFVANSTELTIKFVDGAENIVDAGHISVGLASGVQTSGNGGSYVTVNAVTGTELQVTASVQFGFDFAASEVVTSTIGSIDNVTVVDAAEELAVLGYDSRITFSLTGFTQASGEIEIKVVSALYNVQFVYYDTNNNEHTQTINNVKLGDKLTGFTVPSMEGYAFAGFYTYLGGAGRQYVDASGNASVWNENGYTWNGTNYVKDTNFNAETSTYRLFASFIIDKTRITIDTVPPAIREQDPTVAVRVVITNFQEANSWTTADDPYMAEVLYGANINIEAPKYEGYEFAYWQITRTDPDGRTTTEERDTVSIATLNHNGYPSIHIVAVYKAHISVVTTTNGSVSSDGGDAHFIATEGGVHYDHGTAADFFPIDEANPITLVATPNDGFTFVGWFVNGELMSTNRSYQINRTQNNPLAAADYEARFEGNTVTFILEDFNAQHAEVVRLQINKEDQDLQNTTYSVKVGDQINIYINVDAYWSLTWQGVSEGAIRHIFTSYSYKVNWADAKNGVVTLKPVLTQESYDLTIKVSVDTNSETTENQLAGIVRYIGSNGLPNRVINSTTFTALLGDKLTLEVAPNANYRVERVTLNGVAQELVEGSTTQYVITLVTDIDAFNVEVVFAREIWTQAVPTEYTLKGAGTQNNPYQITSAEDIAFMAYKINVCEDAAYANAVYKVGRDIDLTGKYWDPIGTIANPFNGTFDFGSHDVAGITVVYGYQGEVKYNGLFGQLGPNANISKTNSELMIVLIVVGIILLLIIIALIIFFVVRRKRRKKLEELANS